MNFVVPHRFSSGLLPCILLQLRDNDVELSVHKTGWLSFVQKVQAIYGRYVRHCHVLEHETLDLVAYTVWSDCCGKCSEKQPCDRCCACQADCDDGCGDDENDSSSESLALSSRFRIRTLSFISIPYGATQAAAR
jgi:hypothetical protein